MEFTHIEVTDISDNIKPPRKTKTWEVRNKYDNGFIGNIQWFGRWRKYAFYPQHDCVFEEVCMRELSDFIVEQTKAHKSK